MFLHFVILLLVGLGGFGVAKRVSVYQPFEV
jgi:hypothetical protein